MSRPSQNGGVKKLADMTPEQQVLTCAWGPDAVENETFQDAFTLSLAMHGGKPGVNSDSGFKVGVTVEIDPDIPGGRNPSEDDWRGWFSDDMENVFQRMICKTLDAAHSGDVDYLRDLADFLEANAKKEDVTDPLRIWLLQYKEHASVLNEILAIWNKGLAETIETRIEISKEMLPDIEKELFSTMDIESMPDFVKELLAHVIKDSLAGLIEKSNELIEWTLEPVTIRELCWVIPESIDERDADNLSFQKKVRRICDQLNIPYRDAKKGRPKAK